MKNYKGIALTVLLLIGALVLIIGISKLANTNKSGNGAQANISNSLNSVLSASEMSFDFGSISMARGNVSHTFKIKNKGSEPLVITQVYTSCMCTSANLIIKNNNLGPFGMLGHGFNPAIHENLSPREEVEVKVVFDPAAHGPAGLGEIERVVSLENSGKDGKLDLLIRANVTP